MSNRAASFVEQWVSENAVKPVEGAPAGDDSEARLRAEACLSAAKDEGIAREDIEEETGDLTIDSIKLAVVELVGCSRIPRLQFAERGSAKWQDGGRRSSWR